MSLSSTPNGRRVLFAALYFSEGAPIGFIWWALPTVLAARDESIEKITAFTAMLVWPWALKFLWAPLVDALRGPRWGHRAWIVSAQLVMGATMLPLAWLDVQRDMAAVYWLLLAHAFAATTQDVAIDAWAIRLTDPAEHGRINAAMAMGKYVGRWLFGAGLLIVWSMLGAGFVVGALVVSIWVTAGLVMVARDAGEGTHGREAVGVGGHVRTFGRAMSAALRQRNTWLGLFVALVSGAGFEATGAVAGPLLVKLGCDVAAVGWWRSAWVAALVVGAWLGGVSSDRWGHRRCVAAYLVLLAAVIAATAVMLTGEPGPVRVALALTGVYVGIGLFLATSYALFMDLTDPRIGGTQFSAFMGATNGCEAWSGAAVGRLIALLGYPVALMVMVLASLASLPVLALLRDKPPTDEG